MPLQPRQKSKTISQVHEELWAKGIRTKSMVLQYLSCPLKTYQRHQLGIIRPPGFAARIGSIADEAMQEWGRRVLHDSSDRLSRNDIHDLLDAGWGEEIEEGGVEVPKKLTKKQVIGNLVNTISDWSNRHRTMTRDLGHLTHVQGEFGHDGSIVVQGEEIKIPIAGHPDFVYEEGVLDLKVVGDRSLYRRAPTQNMIEHVMHSLLAEKAWSGYLLGRWEAQPKRGAPKENIEISGMKVYPCHVVAVTRILESVETAIRAESYPACGAAKIGMFPCTPDYCGYFGDTCPVTRGLDRKVL